MKTIRKGIDQLFYIIDRFMKTWVGIVDRRVRKVSRSNLTTTKYRRQRSMSKTVSIFLYPESQKTKVFNNNCRIDELFLYEDFRVLVQISYK